MPSSICPRSAPKLATQLHSRDRPLRTVSPHATRLSPTARLLLCRSGVHALLAAPYLHHSADYRSRTPLPSDLGSRAMVQAAPTPLRTVSPHISCFVDSGVHALLAVPSHVDRAPHPIRSWRHDPGRPQSPSGAARRGLVPLIVLPLVDRVPLRLLALSSSLIALSSGLLVPLSLGLSRCPFKVAPPRALSRPPRALSRPPRALSRPPRALSRPPRVSSRLPRASLAPPRAPSLPLMSPRIVLGTPSPEPFVLSIQGRASSCFFALTSRPLVPPRVSSRCPHRTVLAPSLRLLALTSHPLALTSHPLALTSHPLALTSCPLVTHL
ncbi:hypothetical protein GSI_04710 [Ganoderma sinense ZZ0214-1]|uniref:Uncharacterized protein n=1 Tax=Ganoderma sinense ZZ0214-1 TaxID=1077348 RepID=A0A2G8SHM2_9APHY|nr:hypothetical protein GSI_04710 [Ganoderma sinense ZZ0214-1]